MKTIMVAVKVIKPKEVRSLNCEIKKVRFEQLEETEVKSPKKIGIRQYG